MTVTSLPELLEAAGRLTAVTQEVDPASVPDLVRAGGRPGRHLWGRGGQVILGSGRLCACRSRRDGPPRHTPLR